MRAPLLVSLPLALTSISCGTDTPAALPPCDLPQGCLQVERIDGTCRCREWQLVSIKPVPVKYVVVGVVHAPIGNQTMVSVGHWSGGPGIPATAADFGSRWRSQVRTLDGSELVASVGPIDSAPWGFFGSLTPTGATSAALAMSSGTAMGTSIGVDVPSRSQDEIFIWMNPAVAVATDYVGGRSAAWSAGVCTGVATCPADVFIALAGWLDGSVATSNPYVQATLDRLDAADRAAILQYDPLYDPGWDPAAIAGDPRFQQLTSVAITSGAEPVAVQPLTWVPCAGTLDDADFPVLARSAEVPYGSGETFLLQHSILSASATCTPQQPGLVIGTSTPGCSIQADVFVDRAFGTLLMLPTSVSAACTGP